MRLSFLCSGDNPKVGLGDVVLLSMSIPVYSQCKRSMGLGRRTVLHRFNTVNTNVYPRHWDSLFSASAGKYYRLFNVVNILLFVARLRTNLAIPFCLISLALADSSFPTDKGRRWAGGTSLLLDMQSDHIRIYNHFLSRPGCELGASWV